MHIVLGYFVCYTLSQPCKLFPHRFACVHNLQLGRGKPRAPLPANAGQGAARGPKERIVGTMAKVIADAEIKFRVTSRAKQKWALLADQSDMSLSEWIKLSCRTQARNGVISENQEHDLSEALRTILSDLNSKAGNNLNQIAYHANLTGTLKPVDDAIVQFNEFIILLKNTIRHLSD